MYKVVYAKEACDAFKEIKKQNSALIISWVEKNLVGCENPRYHGKALTADAIERWRYRVGNYRILAEIQDAETTILILGVCRGCNA